jgi:hypothetical protein
LNRCQKSVAAIRVASEKIQSSNQLVNPYQPSLPEARKTSALHLAQCATATDERDRADHSNRREDLEQRPRGVVEEEDPFDREERAEENGVRNGRRLESSREMADIAAEEEPLRQVSAESVATKYGTHHYSQERQSS